MRDKLFLAVDIGGTAVKLALIDGAGTMRTGTSSFSVDFDGYKTPILSTVVKCCEGFLREHSVSCAALTGIGVSATGGINSRTGTVEGAAGHLPNYAGSPIGETMCRTFGVPAHVLNDANAAALGEVWLGAAQGKSDVIVLTVGTGIGGGIIVDSRILLGRKGFAGEIGHIPINISGETCYCGNKGCLEYLGATTALVRRVRAAVQSGTVRSLSEENINGRTIFAALDDDPTLKAIVDRWIFCIAEGIVGLVHTFNPELVLIGGGVSAQQQRFIEPLKKYVTELVMPIFADGLEIRAAKLHNDAGLYGAVRFCMQEMHLA